MEELENKFSEIKLIIDKNKYINKKIKYKIDKTSLTYILNNKLSQSNLIRLGFSLEKFLTDLILYKNNNIKDFKQKVSKTIKQDVDHLFLLENTIYYSELKSNINLDTEKSKATCDKIKHISEKLKILCPNYKIKSFLVSCRYYKKDIIPKILLNKYKNLNVLGINDYLSILKINFTFKNEEDYKIIINYIADKIFNNSLQQDE